MDEFSALWYCQASVQLNNAGISLLLKGRILESIEHFRDALHLIKEITDTQPSRSRRICHNMVEKMNKSQENATEEGDSNKDLPRTEDAHSFAALVSDVDVYTNAEGYETTPVFHSGNSYQVSRHTSLVNCHLVRMNGLSVEHEEKTFCLVTATAVLLYNQAMAYRCYSWTLQKFSIKRSRLICGAVSLMSLAYKTLLKIPAIASTANEPSYGAAALVSFFFCQLVALYRERLLAIKAETLYIAQEESDTSCSSTGPRAA
jgi:hypothetical protein